MFWKNVQDEIQLRNLILWLYWSPLNFRQETYSSVNTAVQKKSWASWAHYRRNWKPVEMTQEETEDEYIGVCFKILYCVWVSRFWLGWGQKGWLLWGASAEALAQECSKVGGGIVAFRGISWVWEAPGKPPRTPRSWQRVPSWETRWQDVCGTGSDGGHPPLPWRTMLRSMWRDPRAGDL